MEDANQDGISRRSFLRAAGSISTLALLGVTPVAQRTAAASTALTQPAIRYVVTDSRHPESVVYGQKFLALSGQRLEVTDGLTRLWQAELAPMWKGRRDPNGIVAGLTTRDVWHCLAEQARSEWRQSYLLQQHGADADHPSSLVSWVIY